jgi:hypothetical protein
MEVSSELQAPAEIPPVPSDTSRYVPQSRSRRCREEKKITCTYRKSKENRMKVKRREIGGGIRRQEEDEEKRRGSK